MALWRKPRGAKSLTILLAASTMGATSGRLKSGVESYICDNDCTPGSTAVNMWLCGISESNVHDLWACFDNIGRNNIETFVLTLLSSRILVKNSSSLSSSTMNFEDLGGNELATLPGNMFEGMFSLTALSLDQNELTALPGMVFEGLPSLVEVDLRGNPDLRCVSNEFANIVRVEDQNILSSEACDVHLEGTKPCLDSRHVDFRCAGHDGSGILLADADLCGVEACFMTADTVAEIVTINIERNEFSALVANQVQELPLLQLPRPKALLACASWTMESTPASSEESPLESEKPRIIDRRERKREQRRLSESSVGNIGTTYDVNEHVAPTLEMEVAHEESSATPPAWDSSLCMTHWGRSEFLESPDPGGYLIFVDGREQLGGNMYLVSDGLFFAKTLNRTLIEYPVDDSRVAAFGESSSGLGMYWDLSKLCMYHRILDLQRFRTMVTEGRIPADNFVTIKAGRLEEGLTNKLHTEDDAIEFFEEYIHAQVIVMEWTWKSALKRDALQYLRPNAFYSGVVSTLIEEQEDWAGGNFVAVQWRTEWATGNLTECYEEVKTIIDEQRTELGYGTHQVFINTDLNGRTSGTYGNSKKARGAEVLELMQRDYPAALDNRLHEFASNIADTGAKAIVTGLGVASSKVMLASSLNSKSRRHDPDAYNCQKVSSGYIHLIVQWREEVMGLPPSGVHRLFPLD